jgi:hypothetical protein
MKDTLRREKLEDLIFNFALNSKGSDYLPVMYFCIEELYPYGIDPTNPKNPVGTPIDDKFKWTESELIRAILLAHVYKLCKVLVGQQAELFHPKRNFDLETCKTSFNAGSSAGSLLTYMLTLTLRQNVAEEDFNKVSSLLEKFNKDRSKGGKARGNKYRKAKPTAIEEAKILKARDPTATKDDITNHILIDMTVNPDKYGVELGDYPSPSTLRDTWLKNYMEK